MQRVVGPVFGGVALGGLTNVGLELWASEMDAAWRLGIGMVVAGTAPMVAVASFVWRGYLSESKFRRLGFGPSVSIVAAALLGAFVSSRGGPAHALAVGLLGVVMFWFAAWRHGGLPSVRYPAIVCGAFCGAVTTPVWARGADSTAALVDHMYLIVLGYAAYGLLAFAAFESFVPDQGSDRQGADSPDRRG